MLRVASIEPRPEWREKSWKATAAIEYGEIILKGFRIVQQPGQKPWVSLPQSEIRDGQVSRFYPLFECEPAVKREFQRMVLDSWRLRYPGHETKLERKEKPIPEENYGPIDF